MWVYEELFSQFKRALELFEKQDRRGAEILLMEVKDALEGNEEYRELEGEWNLLMAKLHFCDLDLALPYLQKARSMIKGRSKVVPYGSPLSRKVYGPLFVFLKTPGTADETGEKLEQMMELYDSLCGGGNRWDQLYYAQLAFYRGEYEKAQSLFLKAEGSAKKSGNLLEQLCTAEYRCRLAVHMRDSAMWNQAFKFICSMQNSEDRVLREMALCLKSQLRMSVGIMTGVPQWIRCGKFGAVSDGKHYRIIEDRVTHTVFPVAWITYMEYLLYSGDFYYVINAADIAVSLYGLNNMMLYECNLCLYKASAWNALGDREKAMPYLKCAVELLAKDGMWQLAAEFFPTLGENLREEMEPFGEEYVNRYLNFSENFTVKLSEMRKVMMENVFKEPLTEKEEAVAKLAALGLKTEEVGECLSISRNTVKYHLSNAYKKLGIKNRVELKDALESYQESELAYWTQLHKK